MTRAPEPFREGLEHLRARRFLRARRAFALAVRGNGPGRAWACQQLVQTFLRRGEGPRADEFLSTLLSDGDPLLLYARGYRMRLTGDHPAALALLETALRMRPKTWAVNAELGWLRCLTGGMSSGRRLLREGRRHFEAVGDDWGLANVLSHEANLAASRQRLREAMDAYAKAIELKRRCGDDLGLAGCHHGRGLALYFASEHAEAIESLTAGLAGFRDSGYASAIPRALSALGACHMELGNLDEATGHFRSSLRLARRGGHPPQTIAVACNNLGYLARVRGQYRQASRYLNDALHAIEGTDAVDQRANLVASIAELYNRRRQPRSALGILAEAGSSAGQDPGPRAAMMLLTEESRAACLLGDAERAGALAREALRLATKSGRPQALLVQLCEARVALTHALLQADRLPEARRVISVARERVESLRSEQAQRAERMGIERTFRDVNDAHVHVELRRPRLGAVRAWQSTSLTKARSLRERLGHPSSPLGEAPDPERLSTLLGPDVALLEYHVSEASSHVFVLHRGRLSAVSLGLDERAVRRLVDAAGAPFRIPSGQTMPELDAFDPAVAARAMKKIVDPALAVLPARVRRLVIVPDGPLHDLAFETLVHSRPSHRRTFFSETFEIVLAPASCVLAPAHALGAKPRLLSIGHGPVERFRLSVGGRPVEFAPLPEAEIEARAVHGIHAIGHLSCGSAATPEAFARHAPRADVIHVAAHGVSDPLSDDRTGILLAGDGPGEHALLTATAVRSLSLSASLVVLSACETAGGRLHDREGTLSLARACLEAGAGAVLSSRWLVDDAASRVFMEAFHRSLSAGDSRASAAARARRELRKAPGPRSGAWRHPFYWGAFTLADRHPGVLAQRAR